MAKNQHEDHIASCLCCKYFNLNPEGPAYSDQTPGDNSSIFCEKGMFRTEYNPTEEDLHKVIRIAENCVEFVGR